MAQDKTRCPHQGRMAALNHLLQNLPMSPHPRGLPQRLRSHLKPRLRTVAALAGAAGLPPTCFLPLLLRTEPGRSQLLVPA